MIVNITIYAIRTDSYYDFHAISYNSFTYLFK